MAIPRMYVEAPPVTPLPFGLFSVATVPPDDSGEWAGGGVQYEPAFCGTADAYGAGCDTDTPATKTVSEGIGLVTGDAFALYHLFRCKAPGSIQRGMDRAREALRLGEQRGAEVALARQLPLMEGAVDLTPTAGTAIPPVLGVALLEAYSAKNYGGVATLHLPRGTTTLVNGLVERVGTHLETKQGTLIASGGGYVDNTFGPATDPDDPDTVVAPGDTESWLYVTGQVIVRRGPTIEVDPVMRLNSPTNDFVALAERPYVITTECIVGAVLVSTEAYGGSSNSGAGGVNGGGA